MKTHLLLTAALSLATAANIAPAQLTQIPLATPAADWRLKPESEITDPAATILTPAYDMSACVKAVVPGTVFGSYVAAGLEKDPNYGDNVYKVDKTKYDRNFWYRTLFTAPALAPGETLWLNFDGINRKGEIYLNGHRLGLLDGFMQRGKYNITHYIKTAPGEKNALAVLVYFVGRPVPNRASPTYISSDGWDWMPPVPGLLTGITDKVYLTITRQVAIEDPWIRAKLTADNKTSAALSLQYDLNNTSAQEQKCTMQFVLQPGDIRFSQNLTIAPATRKHCTLDPKTIKQLAIENPRLWWPNGYGDPNLYTLEITCQTADGKISDTRKITFGIREYSYATIDGVFRILCNGQPIFVKGGNWGMSEWLLRCRGDEYDLKLRLHNQMHYNMVRNWIGSTTDDEFYDACDKYGIMVWDDFWLNSHKNLPRDIDAFNANAIEKIKRLRNHPSIAVWCGDNEGYPLPPLDENLRAAVATYDGNDRAYHSNSHSDGLSGSGPWSNNHPSWYFTKNPLGFGDNITKGHGFRTELGTAVFTTFESFKKFMPEKDWWPRDDMWNKHFFGKSASNGGPDRYVSTIAHNYGEPTGIEDFCRKAQLLNLEVNKAMYEGWQHNIWHDATGIMTWMSQSAYPSFVWQTYDYYYDLTGAYWGVRKACEPIHIQWSHADNTVKIINTTLTPLTALKAEAIVYNMDGAEVTRQRAENITARPNDATHILDLNFPTDNLAYHKKAVASSTSKDAGDATAVTDGSQSSRWSSLYKDNQWIYIDLGEKQEIATILLDWEGAHAKSYKLQISDDAKTWTDVYTTDNSKGGIEEIPLKKPVAARYIKMQGIKRATQWGFSLYEIEVYGKNRVKSVLTPVHFIRLALTDRDGKLLSDNFYWRGLRTGDYRELNNLPKTTLNVSSGISGGTTSVSSETPSVLGEYSGRHGGRPSRDADTRVITATITNTGQTPAFAIRVQLLRKSDGERILPAIMTDNYFTLLQGETKTIDLEFASDLLPPGDDYILKAEPYNSK